MTIRLLFAHHASFKGTVRWFHPSSARQHPSPRKPAAIIMYSILYTPTWGILAKQSGSSLALTSIILYAYSLFSEMLLESVSSNYLQEVL